jgi:hypothetical protein
MNICIYTENYYKGGLDTFLINLFNAWPDEQDKFTLVCNASHPGLDSIEVHVKRPFFLKRYSYFYTTSISQGQTKIGRWLPLRAFFCIESNGIAVSLFICMVYFIINTFFLEKIIMTD